MPSPTTGGGQVVNLSPGQSFTGQPGDTILGSNYNYIDAGAGPETIYSGLHDTILGALAPNTDYINDPFSEILLRSGNDIVQLGNGSTVAGGTGDATIYGAVRSTDADTIYGGTGHDYIVGGPGKDYIVGEGGTDDIHATDKDTVQAGSGPTTIYGALSSTAHDTIYGSFNGGKTLIEGGAGHDYIVTGSSNTETVVAGSGFDTIQAGSGNATIYGSQTRTGHDTIYGSLSSSAHDYIVGGAGSDFISGDAGTDTIQAGSGNDTIQAGSGNETIYAGSGHATIYAGTGNDYISGGNGSHVYMVGGSGNDTFKGSAGGGDTINGAESPLGGSTNIQTNITGSPNEELADSGTKFAETVVGFSQSNGDFIDYAGGNSIPADTVAAMTTSDGKGNAVIHLPDQSTITLIGVSPSSVNGTFFSPHSGGMV